MPVPRGTKFLPARSTLVGELPASGRDDCEASHVVARFLFWIVDRGGLVGAKVGKSIGPPASFAVVLAVDELALVPI